MSANRWRSVTCYFPACIAKVNEPATIIQWFSVIDLPAPNNFSTPTRTYQGKSFNVYTLRHSQAYPLQAGSLRSNRQR